MTDETHSDTRAAGERGEADGVSCDLIEIRGRIKWFDSARGFGFIVPDNGLPDVLLHVTCLKRDGHETAVEGATIVCDAVRRERGLQVLRIHSIDVSTAPHPSELPVRTHVSVVPTGGFQTVVVKWFNRQRGFGFVTCGEGTPDIFIHMETMRRYGLMELVPGQTLLVRYGDGPKGRMVAEVRLPDIGHAPVSH
ncbi:MAG: cold-shock protein [Pseudochelatococcus sp.]|uniref:cold-shock protein n=1 Tax=Pseudochelatococcus sp. TaxID=2020869 RepID=UPI003D934BFB